MPFQGDNYYLTYTDYIIDIRLYRDRTTHYLKTSENYIGYWTDERFLDVRISVKTAETLDIKGNFEIFRGQTNVQKSSRIYTMECKNNCYF